MTGEPLTFKHRSDASVWLHAYHIEHMFTSFGLRSADGKERFEIRPKGSNAQVGWTREAILAAKNPAPPATTPSPDAVPQGAAVVAPALPPKARQRNGALGQCAALFAANPGIGRKAFVELAVAEGINPSTASVQFGALSKAAS